MEQLVDLRIAELMASRMSHELAGPLGAVNNGVELVAEMGGTLEDDVAGLISDSAIRASGLLQLYRMAYGSAGEEGVDSLATLTAVVGAADTAGRFQFTAADGTESQPLAPGVGRVLLNLVVLATETAPRGGKIGIDLGEDRSATVSVTAQGAMLPPDTRRALDISTPVADIDSRSIQAYVAATFAARCALRIELHEQAADGLAFSLNEA